MNNNIRVLIIEDGKALAEEARREIEEAFADGKIFTVSIRIETDFNAGVESFRLGETDVVVLDVRNDGQGPLKVDDSAGCRVYEQIKQARFAPVIFWTALPMKVEDIEMPPIVKVLRKEETHLLPKAIEDAVSSRAVDIIADIEQDVATVLREHMWDELAPNWNEYTADEESSGISWVLLSRLSRILEEKAPIVGSRFRYLYPPASGRRAPGDLLFDEVDESWYVILTPACDFAQEKVEFSLLGKASKLEANRKFKNWIEKDSNNKWNELRKDVLSSTRGRYYYLPAFRDIPDLVLDLENVRAVQGEELGLMTPVASLISPFAEALLVQHSHYRGRIGIPELDFVRLRRRLRDTYLRSIEP